MARYGIERIDLGTATELKGMVNVSLDAGIQSQLVGESSMLTGRSVVTRRIVPMVTATTLDINGFFSETDWSGGTANVPHINITGTSSPCDIYLREIGEGGDRPSDTAIILRITKGVIVPTRITGAPVAQLEFAVYPCWDGTNAPVQTLTSQDLPGGTAGASKLYTLHSVVNGSTALHRIQEWALEFGITVERPPNSSFYPPDAIITKFAPTATWATADLTAALTAANFKGSAAATGGLKLQLAEADLDDPALLDGPQIVFRTGTPGSVVALTNISANADAVATASFSVGGVGTSDQGTPPLSWTSSATLPSESTSVKSFRLGPLFVASNEHHVRNVSIDFGNQPQPRQTHSSMWPLEYQTLAQTPQMTFNFDDDDELASLGEGDHYANVRQWFRAITVNSEPLADTDTNHVGVDFLQAFLQPAGWTGDHADYASGQVTAHAKTDDTSGAAVSMLSGAIEAAS